jgi:hypothetical protein
MKQVQTPQQIAALFGCTPEQARIQLAKNAADLRASSGKAGKGKLRGFTAKQYADLASDFEQAAR